MRVQSALEGASTAAILAAAAALVSVYLARSGLTSEPTGIALLGATPTLVLLGALVGALRPQPTHVVATRIDRAADLSDRLATAVAFERNLGREAAVLPDTAALMRAAIRDAAAHVQHADAVAATPFRIPRDAGAAACFTAVATTVALLAIPPAAVPAPSVARIAPHVAARGDIVTIDGNDLCAGPCSYGAPHSYATASRPDLLVEQCNADGTPRYELAALPASLSVHFGPRDEAVAANVVSWTRERIELVVPHGIELGPTTVTVLRGSARARPIPFVVEPGDDEPPANDCLPFDSGDIDYARHLLGKLDSPGEVDSDLRRFAEAIDALLARAQAGTVTKEQILDELAAARDELAASGKIDGDVESGWLDPVDDIVHAVEAISQADEPEDHDPGDRTIERPDKGPSAEDLLGETTERREIAPLDTLLTGTRGEGLSRREVIRSAAQAGFATRAYEDVFVRYEEIVEDVVRAEQIPRGYRRFIHDYFVAIEPRVP